MRARASSFMLEDFRSHLRASFVTESKRENIAGICEYISAVALRDNRWRL